jgi:acetyl esterase/lipase
VCLLHGGFWRMPYGRDEMDAIARDLAARGFAVWNLEYRRVGAPGGGWPGTLDDVGAGIDHLATLVGEGVNLDLERVAVVGHSAGGQLALWSASRASPRVRVAAAAGLAPVADLDRRRSIRNAIARRHPAKACRSARGSSSSMAPRMGWCRSRCRGTTPVRRARLATIAATSSSMARDTWNSSIRAAKRMPSWSRGWPICRSDTSRDRGQGATGSSPVR